LLKARVIIYSDNHHVRLLPPERLVVNQSLLGSREPTLLCHHLRSAIPSYRDTDKLGTYRRWPFRKTPLR